MKSKHEAKRRTAAPMGVGLLTATFLGLLVSVPSATAHDEPCRVGFGSSGPTLETSGCQHNAYHGVGGVWNTTVDNFNAQCEWALGNPAVGKHCPFLMPHFPPREVKHNEVA